jgi:hypothetical protein
VAEALNIGSVVLYPSAHGRRHQVTVFQRAYGPRYASEGHTWLPINIGVDQNGKAYAVLLPTSDLNCCRAIYGEATLSSEAIAASGQRDRLQVVIALMAGGMRIP